ncbi:hypothetical protein STTU_4971 [Streptomyces sp. Tu6071]|uniref:DUF6183 family protein n=1 Tax=Streptomyces sp. Tu6071 TaxID=355249 RepID=UPI00020E6064|nr:DUF6183 family protein [Streptomyces sp. Tu6071]EGJ77761.1 hypothetical protein STTU_4971 [Streptomyces sp. Tu6071]
MNERVGAALRGLSGREGVADVDEMAERAVAAGDARFLGDLGVALAGSGLGAGRHRHVFRYLLRLLCLTPGREYVEGAVRLVAATNATADGATTTATAPPPRARYSRLAAALLAEGQSAAELAAIFAGGSRAHTPEELRACLVHELVLRGTPPDEVPALARWAHSPHWSHHPLHQLPLELLLVEKHPVLASNSPRGGSRSLPDPRPGDPVDPGRPGSRRPLATDLTTDAFRAAAGAAVLNWCAESNGEYETGCWELSAPATEDTLPELLRGLGLSSLGTTNSRRRLALTRCAPEQVWGALFAAAAHGGAYNSGEHGAYGRLAAWRSLAALVGAPSDADPARVEEVTRGCAWYGFAGSTKWFHEVAWDIGFAAVRPGGRGLAVLAATDTD